MSHGVTLAMAQVKDSVGHMGHDYSNSELLTGISIESQISYALLQTNV